MPKFINEVLELKQTEPATERLVHVLDSHRTRSLTRSCLDPIEAMTARRLHVSPLFGRHLVRLVFPGRFRQHRC